MPLLNVRTFRTESEAVNFAIAARINDTTNYNLEKPRGEPFDRRLVETLLKGFNYKEYVRFSLDIQRQIFRQGRGGKGDYCETTVSPAKPNPWAAEILDDFVKRLDKPEMYVDPRHRDFHDRVAGPVKALMQSNLLRLEPRMENPQSPYIHVTEFAGPHKTKREVALDEVMRTFDEYVKSYYAPLKLESTKSGEFRFDQGHIVDALNSHNFAHIHVYHSFRPYHTTLRLERGA